MSAISKKHAENPEFAENRMFPSEPDIEERIYLWLHEKRILSADGKANLPKLNAEGENAGFSRAKIKRKPSELLEKRQLAHLNLKLHRSETD